EREQMLADARDEIKRLKARPAARPPEASPAAIVGESGGTPNGINEVLLKAIQNGEPRPAALQKLVNKADFRGFVQRGLLRAYEYREPSPGMLLSLPEGGLLVDRLVDRLKGDVAAANALFWGAAELKDAELLPASGELLVFGAERHEVEVASSDRTPDEDR